MENKTAGFLVLIATLLSGVAGVTLTPDNLYYKCDGEGWVSDCINGVKACDENGVCTRCYWNESNPLQYDYCKEGVVEYTSQIDRELQLGYSINLDEDKELWLNSTASKKNTTTEQEVQSIVDDAITGDIKQKLQQEFFTEWTRIVQEDKVAEAVEALKLI